ncbi:MAG: NAD(+) synthase [Deltaproteobacteria bacterium]|nr:NAD(+) synthase [Deltaproteobacteria bacterium]
MGAGSKFFNLYGHGFIRAAACIPEVKVSDPEHNVRKTIELVQKAADKHAVFALFPELGISGYSNEDLFFQEALLEAVIKGLKRLCDATKDLEIIIVVGAPLKVVHSLYNCGIIIHKGLIKGIAVKSYLPNQREFYEARHFCPSRNLIVGSLALCGQKDIPIGADLIFQVETIPNFSFYIELCEDVWAPIPPSGFASLAGAILIGNLSASNITVGKDEYRRELASNQSARCLAAYIYTAAGAGESTTDLAWDGHALVYENGTLIAESERFSWDPQVIFADIDLERLAQDRMRTSNFRDSISVYQDVISKFRNIALQIELPQGRILLDRHVSRFPYVPGESALRDKRCFEIYNIQVQGLTKRMKSAGIENLVIGVSGGLDSTQALIVCARTMDVLGLPRTNIKAYTMPGFATSNKTYTNAGRLMRALGVESGEIDIKPSCLQMMKDISHPYAEGKDVFDVTFENIQAGDRTSHLFRIANLRHGLVVGTGDLSELALGWCTYGVGDHMSHYNVNVSVPKTLIQYLIRWVSSRSILGNEASAVLNDILDTEISPELIPGTNGDQPAQSTQAVIGPYELQDFFTFYTTRFGYAPAKMAFIAYNAWRDKTTGLWPDVPEHKRNAYSLKEIKEWLEVFLHRFFKLSQYKRSCIPNGPKVGSGGSLSPRGDYRAPSDGESAPWMADLANIPDVE